MNFVILWIAIVTSRGSCVLSSSMNSNKISDEKGFYWLLLVSFKLYDFLSEFDETLMKSDYLNESF